jgi:TetR/AcrR family fatty acid metabolism transcriptional regulator
VSSTPVSIPPTRWQRRPDDRPDALMTAALDLVRRVGYRRVRLEDIAAAAGVSKATVYHYFANKDDLLTRAVETRMAGRHAEIEAKLAEAPPSAEAKLRIYLRELWDLSLSPNAGMWQRLLVSEIVTEAPQIFSAWAEGLVQRWETVERLIRDGQNAGEFRSDVDAAVAARMVVSGLSHQALFHVHFGMNRIAECDSERLLCSALEQFIRSLAAPVSRSPG